MDRVTNNTSLKYLPSGYFLFASLETVPHPVPTAVLHCLFFKQEMMYAKQFATLDRKLRQDRTAIISSNRCLTG